MGEGIGIVFSYVAIAMAAIMLLWLIFLPFKLVKKIIINIILGIICIVIYNYVSKYINFEIIKINFISLATVGVLGVPGFIALVIINGILF